LFEQFFVSAIFATERFITHSQNKNWGTADVEEHRPFLVVVGAGNPQT
jgi:hypothetical protein